MYHIVYRITNTVNGKIYVGKHSTTNLNDDYLGSGTLIKKAIVKHGRGAFTREILELHASSDEAYTAEVRLIAENRSQDRTIGYNMSPGGEGSFCAHTEESREKISRTLSGKKKPPRSEEHCRKLSETKTGLKKSLEERARLSASMKASPNVGHAITQETKDKIAHSLHSQIQSQETRDKRAASMRAAWARKKALLSSCTEVPLLVETSALDPEDV